MRGFILINYITESLELHLFFARIMKEHAWFIRGLLDPTEETLIDTANNLGNEYKALLEEASEIQSIILPLLADHVLREANHYLRILS